MELVILEEMIPEDHLLWKIDRMIDFSFIRKMCAPLYCLNNGRPAIDPETLFRMSFVGYLYGIRSERRLEEEIKCNLAYKWFCGLDILGKAPDESTISANRRRGFRENDIAEKIFSEILAGEHRLVCHEQSFLTAAIQNMSVIRHIILTISNKYDEILSVRFFIFKP